MASSGDRWRMFAQEYLVDLNGTQAAIRAGYAPEAAGRDAHRLLRTKRVSAEVSRLMSERMERVKIDQDFVVSKLLEVSERCMQARPVMVWDRSEKRHVQDTDENGNSIWTFDSTGANRALELLGKHLGIFVNKIETSGEVKAYITVDGRDLVDEL